MIIVALCNLKNDIYIVLNKKEYIGTFQIKKKENTLFFEKLAINPKIINKGYGTECLKFIYDIAKENDCEKVIYEVYDKSDNAIKFYKKNGFDIIAEKESNKYNELIMSKEVR